MTTRRQRSSGPIRAAVCALLLAAGVGLVLAADIGEAVIVRNDVRGTPPGGAVARMKVGDGVPLGLALATAQASGIKMTFAPEGALTLGPSTEMTIDQTVVDRATGRDTSKLSLAVGRLRVTLGALFGGDVEVTTPSAVVGIKGSDAVLSVDPSGRTTILTVEGKVGVRSRSGGDEVPVPPDTFSVVEPDGQPGAPAPIDPRQTGLLQDALNDFGSIPEPPPTKPDDKLARVFGAGAAGGPGLDFETATASPAAGGSAFSDPAASAFPISPFLGFGRLSAGPIQFK